MTKLYPCCPNDPYNSVEYNITINRKNNHYRPVVFVPALCKYTFFLIKTIFVDDSAARIGGVKGAEPQRGLGVVYVGRL